MQAGELNAAEICREYSQLETGSVVSQCNSNNMTAPGAVLRLLKSTPGRAASFLTSPRKDFTHFFPLEAAKNPLLQSENLSGLNEMFPVSAQYCQNHLPRQ